MKKLKDETRGYPQRPLYFPVCSARGLRGFSHIRYIFQAKSLYRGNYGAREMQATTQIKTPVVGKHVYGELYGVDEALLKDEERLRKIVIEAAHIAKMHLVEVNSWRFKGGDKEGFQ